MNKSIDESLDKIAGSNLQTSEVEEERQINQEIQVSEAKDKMEEVLNSFYVFLPHLKRQIDFAHQHGQALQGKHSKNLAGGILHIEAQGSKSKSLWSSDYVLRLYFNFKAKKSSLDFQYDPLVILRIPQAEGKEKKTKVDLYFKRKYILLKDYSETKKVRLPELIEIVTKAYQESSNAGMEIFEWEVARNYNAMNYKMLLPYVFSAIPDLTINAAHHLSEIVIQRKEAVIANTEYLKELKAPDVEEAIELLNQKKP